MSDEFKRLKRMKHTDIFTRVLHEEIYRVFEEATV